MAEHLLGSHANQILKQLLTSRESVHFHTWLVMDTHALFNLVFFEMRTGGGRARDVAVVCKKKRRAEQGQQSVLSE